MLMRCVKQILLEKNHPGIQFLKYVLCGQCAFAADIVVFYLLAIFVIPALTPDDIVARLFGLELDPISDSMRLRNFWIGKTCSFMGANTVAYVLNVLFVFKGGKHKVLHEVGLFFLVSFAAFFCSMWTGDILIRFFDAQTTVSNITAIFFATLFNYTGRKFFIFHG